MTIQDDTAIHTPLGDTATHSNPGATSWSQSLAEEPAGGDASAEEPPWWWSLPGRRRRTELAEEQRAARARARGRQCRGAAEQQRGGQAVLFVNANWPFSYNVKREGSVRFAVENSDMTMLDAPTPTANSIATC